MLWIATAAVTGASVFYQLGAISVWLKVQMWFITALLALIATAGVAYVANSLWSWRKSSPSMPRLTCIA